MLVSSIKLPKKRMNLSVSFKSVGMMIPPAYTKSYIKMWIMASPTADMETRVPMQCLITSYLAASNWALKPWISCKKEKRDVKRVETHNVQVSNKITKLTMSSLFVRLVVSVFWLASSSRIRLQLIVLVRRLRSNKEKNILLR